MLNNIVKSLISLIFKKTSFTKKLGAVSVLNIPYGSGETAKVNQVEICRNTYIAFIRVVFDQKKPETSFVIKFNPKIQISGFGLECWYEHSIDFGLGPAWHPYEVPSGEDKYYLQQVLDTLKEMKDLKLSFLPRFYLNEALKKIENLVTE